MSGQLTTAITVGRTDSPTVQQTDRQTDTHLVRLNSARQTESAINKFKRLFGGILTVGFPHQTERKRVGDREREKETPLGW